MIAFGCAMSDPELYTRWAKPGIERVLEPDSALFAIQATGSINRSYNLIMGRAAELAELEALVLVHQDAEIVDPLFCSKVRETLSDPDVGVAGCVGSTGAPGIAWWEGEVSGGSAVYRYGELPGNEIPALAFGGEGASRAVRTGEVDTLDGFVLVLSPWAVRTLRFDESLSFLYGYDFDFCRQVREAARKVVTADLAVRHHHPVQLVGDNEPWMAAHMRTAEKWETEEQDWKSRARRAEAEAALARLLVRAKEMQLEAQDANFEERLREVIETPSWRLTEPLRRVNALRRRLGKRLVL